MALKGEIAERLEDRVRMTKGNRVGFTYAVVKDRDTAKWFDTPPPGVYWRIRLLLRVASSYWGMSELPALCQHLDTPAPRHNLIAGWNDDAWIATEDPETILYMDGLD